MFRQLTKNLWPAQLTNNSQDQKSRNSSESVSSCVITFFEVFKIWKTWKKIPHFQHLTGSHCISMFTDDSCCSKTSVLLYDPACSASAHRKCCPLHGSQRQCVNPCLSHSLPLFWLTAVWLESKTVVSQSLDPVTYKQNPGQNTTVSYNTTRCFVVVMIAEKTSSSNVKLKCIKFVVHVSSQFYSCALQVLFFPKSTCQFTKA